MKHKTPLLIGAFFSLITFLVLMPATLKPWKWLPIDGPRPTGMPEEDQAFFLYAFWWVREAVFSRFDTPWFCPILNAPDGQSFLYSTIVPLYGIVFAPLGALVNDVFVYNIVFALAVLMLPVTGYLVVRELGGNWRGALVAAAFLFLPAYITRHVSHLNVASVWWVLLVFWTYLRFQNKGRMAWAVLCGVLFGLGFYVSFYHTIHLGLLLGLDVGRRLWKRWRESQVPAQRRKMERVFIIAAALAFLLLFFSGSTSMVWIFLMVWILAGAFLLWNNLALNPDPRYVRRSLVGALVGLILLLPFFLARGMDERHRDESAEIPIQSKVFWSAHPLRYVLSDPLIDGLREKGRLAPEGVYTSVKTDGEFAIFPGYGLYALLVLGLLFGWRASRGRRYWLFFAAVFVVLSWGPSLVWAELDGGGIRVRRIFTLPAMVFDLLPMIEGYRVFARLGIIANLCLVIFVGLRWEALEGLFRKRKDYVKYLVLGLVVVLVIGGRIAANRPDFQKVQLPEFYERLAQVPEEIRLFEFPIADWLFLYPQTIHQKPLVNFATSRLSKSQEEKWLGNAFLYHARSYDYRYPAELGRPLKPVNKTTIKQDFEQLGIDGVIVHRDYLKPDDATTRRRFFENFLGLQLIYESDQIQFYRNPRGKAFAWPE
ncbi:MAG: hypothetical protein ACLFQ6_11160 [Candidatus Sumerlaeia bacterium]